MQQWPESCWHRLISVGGQSTGPRLNQFLEFRVVRSLQTDLALGRKSPLRRGQKGPSPWARVQLAARKRCQMELPGCSRWIRTKRSQFKTFFPPSPFSRSLCGWISSLLLFIAQLHKYFCWHGSGSSAGAGTSSWGHGLLGSG